MEWLQTLTDSSTTPIVTAFLFGLLTAISPCPLATNIAAIGFIGREIENRHKIFLNGVFYTFGRVIAYTLLGIILIGIIRQGTSMFGVQKFISQWGERLLGPVLMVIGVLMMFANRLNFPQFGFNGKAENIARKGSWGALALGILFAMAFCPSSAMFYFGMLIPMSVSTQAGFLLPVVYAIATAFPVFVVAWVLAFSVGKIGKFYGRMKTIERWTTIVVAILFILIGLYECFTIYK